jgi:hypothetical protein
MENEDFVSALTRAKSIHQLYNDDETKQLVNGVETQKSIYEARDSLLNNSLETAFEKVQHALNLTPNSKEAKHVQKEIDVVLSIRKAHTMAFIVFIVCLSAGLLVGLYFWLRPRNWVLEGVGGICRGQTFPLQSTEVKIGTLCRREGEHDIIISNGSGIAELHCSVVRDGKHWYLINMSANGTKINGVEANEKSRLKKGDRLILADEAVLQLRSK